MSNLALAIYAIAKVASTGEFLQNDPVQIDRVLTRISLTDNQRIRANCNRAFKNLNSDLNEAIEEGAVSNLIAISLEVRCAKGGGMHVLLMTWCSPWTTSPSCCPCWDTGRQHDPAPRAQWANLSATIFNNLS